MCVCLYVCKHTLRPKLNQAGERKTYSKREGITEQESVIVWVRACVCVHACECACVFV